MVEYHIDNVLAWESAREMSGNDMHIKSQTNLVGKKNDVSCCKKKIIADGGKMDARIFQQKSNTAIKINYLILY